MPSDLRIYRDGKSLRTSRKAYEQIYKPRGWRIRPQTRIGEKGPEEVRPAPETSSPTGGDQTADNTADDEQKE